MRVFRPWGACAIATKFAGRGAIAFALGKKVIESKHHAVLGIFDRKKGQGSWTHGVPTILLPTFLGALGRGTCLKYLLGKRDGGVGAQGRLRYSYQRLGDPWEGERTWNICLEKGTGELVPLGCLRYCYQRFGELWEGEEDARNAFK